MIPLYCNQGHENSEGSRFCRECGERLNLASTPLSQSEHMEKPLGRRYRVLRELGQGGFGRTYLAADTNRFQELCVLKEFAPQAQDTRSLQKAEELFAREAGILYKLQHPQIPRFRELFRAEVEGRGRLFLVQDYVEGQTYQAILRSRRQLGQGFTEREATQLLFQLLPVLSYLHACGVIHRDISPDNLILRNTDGLPVLIDFGGVKQIAAEVASQLNLPGMPQPPLGVTLLGKYGYAPEEQMLTGEVFPHSDLYALAVTVLVLMTGKEPQSLLGDRQQWQQDILSPPLVTVLTRMLAPNPLKRYQSAQAVLQALQALPVTPPAWPAPDNDVTRPPLEHQQSIKSQPSTYPATIALSPTTTQDFSLTTTSPPPPPLRQRSHLKPLLILLISASLGGGGWLASDRWLKPFFSQSHLLPTQPPSSTPAPTPNNSTVEPTYSKAEQARKQAITQRRENLGIDHTFLVSLVNQEFYAKHPALADHQLSKGAEDEAWRSEWDKIANQLLDRLQNLSPEARSRLGQYTDNDIKNRQAAVNQIHLSSRALNDLTDAQFYHLFPQAPNPNLLKQPIGQVWQAIADDQLKSLQAGNSLETIQFPSGSFSQKLSGNLKPGQGKAFLARFAQDQAIRLKLQASSQALRLSFYPPTSKSPALLEDSQTREWTGKLPLSGLYEIVVTANGQESGNYELNLAAADEISVPKQEGEKN